MATSEEADLFGNFSSGDEGVREGEPHEGLLFVSGLSSDDGDGGDDQRVAGEVSSRRDPRADPGSDDPESEPPDGLFDFPPTPFSSGSTSSDGAEDVEASEDARVKLVRGEGREP
eukprot:4643643-Pyramimonas_sp.AAC.1